MTAEVGILNRMGVALAADSAVTIGRQGMEKVYNSANKLFSLSKFHPVGIMIYGGASYMEVPWETIIKTFRQQLGQEKKEKLEDYANLFINFLKTDSRLYNPESETRLVQSIFSDLFKEILTRIESKINNFMEEYDTKPKGKQVEEWISELCFSYLEGFSREDYIDGFEDCFKEFSTAFTNPINEVIDSYMSFEISSELREQIIDLAHALISRNIFTKSSTGLVIAGYGEDELFPSLYEYKIEGVILGKLKFNLNDLAKVGGQSNQNEVTAAIRPFAQKEMVYSFMQGLDPKLEDTIYDTLDTVMGVLPTIIKEKIVPHLTEEEILNIRELGNELIHTFISEIRKNQEEKFVNPVIDVVEILPKEELAAMAEALVNLTSFKRRITIETETVGGPIDVLVITKGDGLVWIRRKHYFKPELNYHFFQNYLRGDNNVTYDE